MLFVFLHFCPAILTGILICSCKLSSQICPLPSADLKNLMSFDSTWKESLKKGGNWEEAWESGFAGSLATPAQGGLVRSHWPIDSGDPCLTDINTHPSALVSPQSRGGAARTRTSVTLSFDIKHRTRWSSGPFPVVQSLRKGSKMSAFTIGCGC